MICRTIHTCRLHCFQDISEKLEVIDTNLPPWYEGVIVCKKINIYPAPYIHLIIQVEYGLQWIMKCNLSCTEKLPIRISCKYICINFLSVVMEIQVTSLVTSAKEVMFMARFICLSACRVAHLIQNY